ncbi:MAG: voltage-gated chloride channel family protein [Bdellovibrio sp.]|nr:voltage-gated chloride channel family protein [Bdellovibrio sp.]
MSTRRNPLNRQLRLFPDLLLWLLVSCLVGVLAGTASAGFLFALELTTQTRLTNPWLLYLLPWAGILIAFIYSRYGKNTDAGNNLLIDEIHNPQKVVPARMTPFVLAGTLLTHLFGGSAGREGTAVQMGGSLADQLTHLFHFDPEKRKTLLMAGISAGFSSVFGTPLAGALFGLEVLAIGKLRYQAILPCFMAAIVADRVCTSWGVHHSTYSILGTPDLSALNILWSLVAGICFGLCALLFSQSSHRLTKLLKKTFQSPLWRAFLGGITIILGTLLLGTDRYLGLGLAPIAESFIGPVPIYDFLLKMIFTLVTLGSGFKGGEVTPLFFIGATLGNALAWILPLPTSLLAGMGFVAVFAGAANTPLACMVMALEIFGTTPGVYTALACIMSYIFSGHTGIYPSQRIEVYKHAQKN